MSSKKNHQFIVPLKCDPCIQRLSNSHTYYTGHEPFDLLFYSNFKYATIGPKSTTQMQWMRGKTGSLQRKLRCTGYVPLGPIYVPLILSWEVKPYTRNTKMLYRWRVHVKEKAEE